MSIPENPLKGSVEADQNSPLYTKHEISVVKREEFNKYATALSGDLQGRTVTVDGESMPVAQAINNMYEAYIKLACNTKLSKEEKNIMADRLTKANESGNISLLKTQSKLYRIGLYNWLNKEMYKLRLISGTETPDAKAKFGDEDDDDENALIKGTVSDQDEVIHPDAVITHDEELGDKEAFMKGKVHFEEDEIPPQGTITRDDEDSSEILARKQDPKAKVQFDADIDPKDDDSGNPKATVHIK